MDKSKKVYWQFIKSKISLYRVLCVISCLLLTLSVGQVSAFAATSFDSSTDKVKQAEQKKRQNVCKSCATEVNQELSPRDKFIAETYFSHKNFRPDSDEVLEVLQEHVKGQDLLGAGKFDDAVILFDSLVKKYPDARHANEGMAIALKERFNNKGDIKDLQSSSEYFIKAIEKAMKVDVIPFISMQVGADLGKLGETEKLNSIFQQLTKQFPNDGLIAIEYAHGLAAANDLKAEELFEKAMALKVDSAPIEYSEWLLDHQKYSDALEILDSALDSNENNDIHFLKGFIFESLRQNDKAQAEYDIIRNHDDKTPESGQASLFNSKYRIKDSKLQKGLNFDDQMSILADCSGLANFKKLIMCEAGGEGQGGARAVGWVVRNRVFNGSQGCVSVSNSGSDLCGKYNSVVTQSGQFVYTCGSTPNTTSVNAANDVWNGWAPEPSMGLCPSGSDYIGSTCTARCKDSDTDGGYSAGDMMFYSTTGSCPTTHPSAPCTSNDGKVCGNGGSDNCFYWIP